MFLLRAVLLLAVVGLAVLVLAWALTGNRKYLGYAGRLAKVGLLLVLVFLALLAFERLLVLV